MNEQYRMHAFFRPGLLAWMLVLVAALFCLDSRPANAACLSPAGEAGAIVYNTDHNMMQFCNGGLWVSMAGGNTALWTTAGSDIYYNNGSAGIGATSVPASAVFALTSTSRGFLSPRMTTAQVNAISSPAEGLVTYDTDLRRLKIRTDSAWVNLGASVMDALTCASGEIANWDGSAWTCSNRAVLGGLNYRLQENGWVNTGATLPAVRQVAGLSVIGNYVYLFGGADTSTYRDTIYRAPVSNPTDWSNVGTLPAASAAMQPIVIGDYIYMFGGFNGSAVVNTIKRAPLSDPTNWSNAGTLPANIRYASVAVIGANVYLYGGDNGSASVDTIWSAPVSNPTSWTNTGSVLPGILRGAHVAVIGDTVYLFGGYGSSYTNVIYSAPVSSPASMTNTGHTLPGNVYNGQLAIIGDNVYLFGGHNGSAATNVVYRAPLSNPAAGWVNTGYTLPGTTHNAALAVIGDQVYMYGGFSGSAALNVIYRAPTNLFIRATSVDLASNSSWRVLSTPTTGAVQDDRIDTVTNNKWCAVDGSGVINCDQDAPNATLVALTDVTAGSAVNGQRLIYNSGTNKWVATTTSASNLNCAMGEIATWSGSAWICTDKRVMGGLNYRLQENSWISAGTLPGTMYNSQTAVIGDYIYMFGGFFNGAYTNVIYRAPVSNPTSMTNTGSTLPAAMGAGYVAVLGSNIYIFGGVNGSGVVNTIYTAPVSNPLSWTNTGSTLPAAVQPQYQGAVIGDYVYLFGGHNGAGGSSAIFRAPVSNPTSWTNTGSTLPAGVYGGNVAVIGNTVYFFGGYTTTYANTIWSASVSDPLTWTNTGAILPAGLYGSSLVIVGDYIHMMGANTGPSAYTGATYYARLSSPANWYTSSGSMPGATALAQAVVVGDHVYVYGGVTTAAQSTIYRAPTTLLTRATNIDTASNISWRVLKAPVTGAVQDDRINTVTNNKWCATNGSGTINCDQDPPSATVAGLSDVAAGSPTNGQRLIYNSGTGKWTATTTASAGLNCASGEVPQWNGSAWLCNDKRNLRGLNYRMGDWMNTGMGTFAAPYGPTLFTAGGYVYLLGGYNGGYLNNIQRAPLSNPTSWTNFGSLPVANYNGTALVIGNYVYLFGGANAGAVNGTNTIYRADASNPTTWTSVGTLPGATSQAQFTIVGNTIYMFGGSISGVSSNVIYSAPLSNPTSWTNTGVTLPSNVHSSVVQVIGDYVYLFGGHNGSAGLNTIYRAPVSNPTAWVNTGGTLPATVYASRGVIVGDYVYLLGGVINGSYSAAIYRAPLSDPTAFMSAGSLPVAQGLGEAAVIGDHVYTFAGYNGSAATYAIFRAPTYLFPRSSNINVASNPSWQVMTAPLTTAVQDSRIATVNNSQWCAVDGSGALNCDQTPPPTTVSTLTDVTAGSPTNGQRLVYNSGTSKWVATTTGASSLNCVSGEIATWSGSIWQCADKRNLRGLNYRLGDWVNTGAGTVTATYGPMLYTAGGYVYLLGGYNGGYLANIQRAPISNPTSWTSFGSLPVPSYDARVLVIGNYVYMFGGAHGGATSGTNVIYRADASNPATWTNVGTLPFTIMQQQMAVIGNTIYMFGGAVNGVSSNVIYSAPVSNPTSWTNTGATLPGNLLASYVTVIGDYIYLFGGNNGVSTNVIYRAPVSNPTAWTNTGATLPVNAYSGRGAIIGDYIYIFGGHNGSAYTSAIMRAPVSNPTAWTNAGSLPTVLGIHEMAVIGDSVYTFAGYNGATSYAIYRAPITVAPRISSADVTANPSWTYLSAPLVGAAQDVRIGTVNNSKWCITNSGGVVNCDQNAPNILANLSDVTSSSATNGQRLVYNSGTSKWTATTVAASSLNCASGEIAQWNGSIWTCSDKRNLRGLNYRLMENSWVSAGTLPAVSYAPQSAIIGNYIYLFGGYNGGAYVTTIYRAPVSNPTAFVNTGGVLPGANAYGQTAIIGDYVYIFGGYIGGAYSNVIYRAPLSDPVNGWVNTGATLPGILGLSQIAVIGSNIYLFGGYNGAGTNVIYRATTANPTSWSNAGTIPAGIYGSRVAVIGDYVYMFGGYTTGALNTIYRAPVSDPLTWTNTGATLPATLYYGHHVIVGDSIYLFGGAGTTAVHRARLSDPTIWSNTGATIPVANQLGSVIAVGGDVYLYGGYNGSYLNTIYRATTYLAPRSAGTIDLASNATWSVMNAPVVGSTTDDRIGTLTNSKWCATNGSSILGCEQDAPVSTLVGLSDVTAGGATNGQRLVYNSGTSKWTATTTGASGLTCASGEIATWSGSAWTCANTRVTSGLDYRLVENGFVSAGSLPGPVYGGSTAVVGDYIYLFGGLNGSTNLNTIYRAPVSNPTAWVNTGSTLPGTVFSAAAAVIGDYVYLFGGNNGSYMNTIWRAPISNPTSWTNTGATLPAAMGWSSVAVIGSNVYLFGGANGSSVNVIYSAPVSNPLSWTNTGATLPAINQAAQLAVIGDYVYLFGGYSSTYLNTIWRAPVSNPTSWTNTGATLPGTSYLSQLVIVGDYVYLLGGHNGGYINAIWRAPLSDPTSWINTGATLPVVLGYAQAVAVGDHVYLLGGYNSAASSVIYRASTFLSARGTSYNVASNRSWQVLKVSPSGTTQDARLDALVANNACAVNAGGTEIDCNIASMVTNDALEFDTFKNTMTLDASTTLTVTGSNELSLTNTGTAYSFVVSDQAADSSPFAIAADGKIGIRALTPAVALDVGGAIVSRGKNAGSATSIDFTQGNTVYTAAACGTFTLSGIQDGGQYTVVVKGSGAGPATFTHAGLTVKTYGTMACTMGKHMTFTFIRAGTDVYVSHITGF